jgi:hypothetical protein
MSTMNNPRITTLREEVVVDHRARTRQQDNVIDCRIYIMWIFMRLLAGGDINLPGGKSGEVRKWMMGVVHWHLEKLQ